MTSTAPEARPTQDQQLRQQHRARRLQCYEEVVRPHAEGVSVRQIAQQMGGGRRTVRRHLNHGAFPEIAWHCNMHSILDRWEAYLLERWQSGCHMPASSTASITSRAIPGHAHWFHDG